MNSETENLNAIVREMQKRRVTMTDGRRYLIYYTFDSEAEKKTSEKSLSEADVKPEMTEESENV